MRIIKLNPDDIEMKTREMVDSFFLTRLHEKDPKGQFLLTKGRIAEDGIQPGEYLVFTYLGDLVYVARSASRREATEGPNARQYPHYFCVELTPSRPPAAGWRHSRMHYAAEACSIEIL